MATIADMFGQTLLDPPQTLRNLFGAPGQYVAGEGAPAGMLSPGNLDLFNRPVIHNPDGSISTVRSASFNFGDGEVLLPTVAPEGLLTNRQAMQRYQDTGDNLGRFFTPEDADAYAQRLHLEQAKRYRGR